MPSTHLPPLEGFQGRLTKSQGWIDETAPARLTFSEMQRKGGGQSGHVPPLNAEVIGATSQASPSYLCQVTAREQSKEHRGWPHVSVIPRLRKVREAIYRNLDSPPVISPPHNKALSPLRRGPHWLPGGRCTAFC